MSSALSSSGPGKPISLIAAPQSSGIAVADHAERLMSQALYLHRQGKLAEQLPDAVGTTQPSYLPYQGRNDRDLQSAYGALVCRANADKYLAAPKPQPPLPDEKVRLGIISGMFLNHTIKGWVTQLDHRKLQVFGYYTGADRDERTELAAARFRCALRGLAWRS